MPTQCFIGEFMDKRPGAMWQLKMHDGAIHWCVRLPNGSLFDIHSISTNGTPWNVTGEAPNFTSTPSINHIYEGPDPNKKGWHGWLTNGVLSDDCEGRTYN